MLLSTPAEHKEQVASPLPGDPSGEASTAPLALPEHEDGEEVASPMSGDPPREAWGKARAFPLGRPDRAHVPVGQSQERVEACK